MTKKKSPILLENKDTPKIPHNSGGRRQSNEGGLITGWMNNENRGANIKITPTNKKMKGKGKVLTKSASASTAETKKPPATNQILHQQQCLHQKLQVGSTPTVNRSLPNLHWPCC